MEGLIVAATLILWVFITTGLFVYAGLKDKVVPAIAGLALTIIGLGIITQKDIDREKKYPCISYETQLRYDPALKMLRNMKVCVERGEWE